MRIAILRIGSVDEDAVNKIQRSLCTVFLGAACEILGNAMPVPQDAYNASRRQHNSSLILAEIQGYVEKSRADRVLGVTGVDLYAPPLTFIFGEAECPGPTAMISLFRLKQEFYGRPADQGLFMERSAKEAVHEVGHTLGIGHCPNAECIMFFSNNIQMTDTKKLKFCEECWPKVLQAIRRLER